MKLSTFWVSTRPNNTDLAGALGDHGRERLIDVAQFKQLAGVSRKYAIPLLEYLDREHITRREGDKRIILE